MAEMKKVRLTLWPDRDHEVGVDEIPGLRAQGLLIGDPPPEPPVKDTADKPAHRPSRGQGEKEA